MTNGYPGGKAGAGVFQTIINQMPPHETYIEPFLGGAAVMRHKRPAAVNIGVELDPDVAAARSADLAISGDDRSLTVISGDALSWLADRRWTGRELVYCDPPYLLSSRRSARELYGRAMEGEAEHSRLIELLRRLPCSVMLSGYASPLYARELAGWRLITFTAATRGRPAVEHLWMNFPEPAALHDYRYLGDDFRERERIGRKARRWQQKLAGLGPLERQAVLSACLSASTIAEAGEAGSGLARNDDGGIAHRRIWRGDPPATLAISGDAGRLSP